MSLRQQRRIAVHFYHFIPECSCVHVRRGKNDRLLFASKASHLRFVEARTVVYLAGIGVELASRVGVARRCRAARYIAEGVVNQT